MLSLLGENSLLGAQIGDAVAIEYRCFLQRFGGR